MIAVLATASVLLLCGGPLQHLRVHARLRNSGLAGQRPQTAPRLPVPPALAARLRRAGVSDPDLALTAWLAALALCALAAPMLPPARVLLAATLLAPPALLAVVGDREGRRRTRQLPDALDAVATALRGGTALAPAIGNAASVGPPLGAELAAIADGVANGQPLDQAVGAWAERSGDTGTGLAAAAITVAARVGGPGARAVDGAAASLRDRLDADAEASALATQGRVSALVLTLAPIAFAVLLTGLDPRAGRFLLGTPTGWLCIALGLGLDAVGAFWMSRLVRRAR